MKLKYDIDTYSNWNTMVNLCIHDHYRIENSESLIIDLIRLGNLDFEVADGIVEEIC